MNIFSFLAILLILGPVFVEVLTGGNKKIHWTIHVFLGCLGILIAMIMVFAPK